VIPLSAWALLLSRTRNAWLGTIVGLAVVALLRAPRALLLVPAGMAAVLILRPAPVMNRLTVTDASSRDRYYMWQAGLDMILDKPVFGQGPGMILVRYPGYRWSEAPNPQTPHLHDNALQIAAERGLPCLVLWLWLVAAVMADAYREARRGLSGAGWVAGGTLAVMSAVMTAGLFEYNFGDSEVLMFTLLVAAMPYARRRERTQAAAGAPA
jgi:O-antigen ligase